MATAHVDGLIEAHGQRFASIEGRLIAIEIKINEVKQDMAAMSPKLEALGDEIWNHDGGPGLKTIVIEEFARRRAAEARLWKRSDKIGVAAIVASVIVAIGVWIGPSLLRIGSDLYRITQEYEKLHSQDIQKLPIGKPVTGEVTTARTSPAQSATSNEGDSPWMKKEN